MRAEVGRMFKNENGKAILPVSFIVPRKNQDSFQADLYPPAPDADPALVGQTPLRVFFFFSSNQLLSEREPSLRELPFRADGR